MILLFPSDIRTHSPPHTYIYALTCHHTLTYRHALTTTHLHIHAPAHARTRTRVRTAETPNGSRISYHRRATGDFSKSLHGIAHLTPHEEQFVCKLLHIFETAFLLQREKDASMIICCGENDPEINLVSVMTRLGIGN